MLSSVGFFDDAPRVDVKGEQVVALVDQVLALMEQVMTLVYQVVALVLGWWPWWSWCWLLWQLNVKLGRNIGLTEAQIRVVIARQIDDDCDSDNDDVLNGELAGWVQGEF